MRIFVEFNFENLLDKKSDCLVGGIIRRRHRRRPRSIGVIRRSGHQ